MADIEKSALVTCSAQQMFELVQRVEDYPLFLPWCSATDIIERNATGMRATVHVSFKGLKTQFSTLNTHTGHEKIHMQLIDGPFSHLAGQWQFKALTQTACKVQLQMHFEFSNLLIERAVGPVFAQIANTMVDSFIVRAQELYPDAA